MTARRGAIALAFVANGLGGPSFLARVPERQRDLDLSDGTLGLVLAGMAVGALVASRFAGRAVGAVGSRAVTVASGLAVASTLWLTGAAPSAPLLFAALFVVGAADASMDIAMNANGSSFERGAGRSVLHGLHAAWSFGALGGAGMAAALAAAGVSLTIHLVLAGSLIAVLTLWSRPGLVPDDRLPATVVDDPHGAPVAGVPRRAWRRPLALLAAATVGGAMIEGAPADWGAVQLERFGVGQGASSLAVAAFMAGMVGGRLLGDRMTDRYGGARMLRGGMVLVVAGLGLGVATAHPVGFTGGLVLAGGGASGLFPLVFSAAGRQPGIAPGVGAATVSLAARLGFLVEPLLVGAMAEGIGLRGAFLVVAGIAAVVAVAAPSVTSERARRRS